MILLLAIFEMQNKWLCLLTPGPPLTHASLQPNWINFSAHVDDRWPCLRPTVCTLLSCWTPSPPPQVLPSPRPPPSDSPQSPYSSDHRICRRLKATGTIKRELFCHISHLLVSTCFYWASLPCSCLCQPVYTLVPIVYYSKISL